EAKVDVRAFAESLGQVGLEPSVELDRMDVRNPVGEVCGESARSGADFECHVVRAQLREAADDPEDVLVDEEVLAKVALGRRERHSRPKAREAFSSIRAASSSASSPRVSAREATV